MSMRIEGGFSVRLFLLLATLGCVISTQAAAEGAIAPKSLSEASRVNESTVGIIYSREALYERLVEDLERALEPGKDLRIIPLVGKNQIQNIYDLLYLNGADLALIRADAVEYIHRFSSYKRLRGILRSITTLSTEKIVLLTGAGIDRVEDLAGQKVALGSTGSGESVTGRIIFDVLDIDIEAVHESPVSSVQRLKSGEIAGILYLLHDPLASISNTDAYAAKLVRDLTADDGVQVLPFPENAELERIYRYSVLDREDLPGLVGEGEDVATHSVEAILATYNWRPENARFNKISLFVNALVDEVDTLKQGRFEGVWNTVNIRMAGLGVARLSLVDEIIAERRLQETQSKRDEENRLLAAEQARKQVRIQKLVDQRNDIAERLADRMGEADPDEANAMFERMNDFIKKLEDAE